MIYHMTTSFLSLTHIFWYYQSAFKQSSAILSLFRYLWMDHFIQVKLILFDSNLHIAKNSGRHMGVSQYQLQFSIRPDPNTHKHSLLHHFNLLLSGIHGPRTKDDEKDYFDPWFKLSILWKLLFKWQSFIFFCLFFLVPFKSSKWFSIPISPSVEIDYCSGFLCLNPLRPRMFECKKTSKIRHDFWCLKGLEVLCHF